MSKVSPSAIKVRTRGFFDYKDMQSKNICIDDIAHALSMLCRFNGHTNHFYSVAQHSVVVSENVLQMPHRAMQGLLHDATEAYIGDMPAPLKRLIPSFKDFEDSLWKVIADKYSMPHELHPDIHRVDKRACLTEARDLMGVTGHDWGLGVKPLDIETIQPLSPAVAKQQFLNRYHELRTQLLSEGAA